MTPSNPSSNADARSGMNDTAGVAVPATAEPVAWRFKLRPEGDWHVDEEKPTHPERLHCVEPLYTAAGVTPSHGSQQ
jgi:hypothetical protein